MPKTMLHGLLAILAISNPQRDSLPRLDTAFVVSRRIAFGSIGRLQRIWNIGDNSNQGLTGFLSANGVFLKQYGVSGIATISRRGADPQQTQVLWNGLPVANAMLGMPDLNTMFLFGSKEIVLTDGGNASVYGSGSVGGTLQVNHGKNSDTGLSITNIASLGNFGRIVNGLDIAASKNQSWLKLQGVYSKSRNNFAYLDLKNNEWQKVQMQFANTVFLNGRILAGTKIKNTHIRLISEWNKSSRNLGMVVASPLFQGTQLDFTSRNMLESNSKFNKISNTNRIGYTRDIIVFEDTSQGQRDTSIAAVKHAQTEWYFNIKKWRVLTGADLQLQSGNSNAYVGIKNKQYIGQFLSIIVPLKKWIINPGVRMEWHEKIPVFSLSAERKVTNHFLLKSNIHNTFRRPTLNDQFWGATANRNLNFESGVGAESSIAYTNNTTLFSTETEACVYNRNLKNAIVWLPKGQVWVPQNVYRGSYYGLQFKTNSRWLWKKNTIEILLNYDYVFTQIFQDKNEQPKQRIFVPNHTGNLLLSLESGFIRFGFNTAYTGMRYIASDNSAFLPYYLLFSLNASRQIWKQKNSTGSLLLEAENLTNTSYQNMPGKPMPGRNYMLTLIVKFKQK